jgi:REP element-mobilizing transposase RayT
LLEAPARAVVGAAVRDQCLHAGWVLHAVHVRTNHVHIVLQGEGSPDRMMSALKARATRYLRQKGLVDGNARPWARHGSTVPLRTGEAVERARRYVVEGQGAALDEEGGAWWHGAADRTES